MRKEMLLKIIFLVMVISGCKKILDTKPDKSLVVPTSLKDFQVILDNVGVMNLSHAGGAGEVCADNYYLTDDNYNSLSINTTKNLYVWEKNVFNDYIDLSDWYLAYRTVYYANVVLEGLSKLENITDSNFLNVKGSALFYRSLCFYEVAQLYSNPYKVDSNVSDLGIPLRINADINKIYGRSTLKETYEKIISDLVLSAELLPVEPFNNFKTRPTKPAAYALLARIYLSIQDYDKALYYSSKTLELFSTLLDYNTDIKATSSTAPIARYNKETIFYAHAYDWGAINFSRAFIDTTLLEKYDANDIRKAAFFRSVSGGYIFKGTYVGDRFQLIFTGIATDEIYLTRAECYARKGDIENAMSDLNKLMINRWKNNGTFVPYTASDSFDALKKILLERRKELIFRGLRWSDLRRLNMDTRFAVTLKRKVNNKEFLLLPKDARYTLQIPISVIKSSGIQQN